MVDAAGVEPAVPEGGGFTVHWGYQFSYTSKFWWSLMESNHLPATPLNNGYRVTAGNGEQAPIICNTLRYAF
jgi:hypothetical protein